MEPRVHCFEFSKKFILKKTVNARCKIILANLLEIEQLNVTNQFPILYFDFNQFVKLLQWTQKKSLDHLF